MLVERDVGHQTPGVGAARERQRAHLPRGGLQRDPRGEDRRGVEREVVRVVVPGRAAGSGLLRQGVVVVEPHPLGAQQGGGDAADPRGQHGGADQRVVEPHHLEALEPDGRVDGRVEHVAEPCPQPGDRAGRQHSGQLHERLAAEVLDLRCRERVRLREFGGHLVVGRERAGVERRDLDERPVVGGRDGEGHVPVPPLVVAAVPFDGDVGRGPGRRRLRQVRVRHAGLLRHAPCSQLIRWTSWRNSYEPSAARHPAR